MSRTPRIDKIQSIGANKIINGAFDFWQRGVNIPNVNGYGPDRFLIGKSGAVEQTVSLTSSLPAISKSQYSMRVEVTTADTSLISTDYNHIAQSIEGVYAKDLYDKDATLKFWVRSNKVGTYTVSLRDGTLSRSYVVEYTIDQADTWQLITVTAHIDTSVGSWPVNGDRSLIVSWGLGTGADHIAPSTNQWLSGNYLSTAGAVNFSDTVGNYIEISDVMLYDAEYGEDLPFAIAGGDNAQELQLCQRYFERGGRIAGNYTLGRLYNQDTVTAAIIPSFSFRVIKRTNPSVIYYYDISDGVTQSKIPEDINNSNFATAINVNAGQFLDSKYWEADAEL